ncbi:MAG: ankyrin repeat domain-containing protein [Candidatus Chromulinivorax sp.]|nr:ankyrin repeat domain-containing protein [Candidatus Chromulinivorax sp.]
MNQNYKIIFFLTMLITCGLQAKLFFDLPPFGGDTLLHTAAYNNNHKEVERLLRKGICVDIRNNRPYA